MAPLVLKSTLSSGEELVAQFLPERGMTLQTFKRGSIEVIDQETKTAFEQRSAGLGPLIGPHFHRRIGAILPKISDESKFPHIAWCRQHGIEDPFSHGIARYAPWKAEIAENKIKASISGNDQWEGVPLKELEGQNFEMRLEASLDHLGLHLNLSVVSESDSLVGIHYYYSLPNKRGVIKAGELFFPLEGAMDANYRPSPDPLHGVIWLETETYRLKTSYKCPCAENSFQIYHPEGASFVCIEPVSSQDPHHPNLTASSLSIDLEILPAEVK